MNRLMNKVVVVTGASAGLGEQICYEAAAKGAIVVACARRESLLKRVKQTCQELSGKQAFYFELDVANPTSVEAAFAEIQAQVGSVDVLVNNAGFGLFQNFVDIDLTLAKKMFEVNVLGMMYFSQKVAIQMAEQKSGHIINVASMAGKMATAKSTVYSATKFAVIGFSNALRLELKPLGVTVATVNPGPIKTSFFDEADPSGTYLQSVGAIVLNANHLAKEIVNAMGTSKREINRPLMMEAAAKLYSFFPRVGDFIAENLVSKK